MLADNVLLSCRWSLEQERLKTSDFHNGTEKKTQQFCVGRQHTMMTGREVSNISVTESHPDIKYLQGADRHQVKQGAHVSCCRSGDRCATVVDAIK